MNQCHSDYFHQLSLIQSHYLEHTSTSEIEKHSFTHTHSLTHYCQRIQWVQLSSWIISDVERLQSQESLETCGVPQFVTVSYSFLGVTEGDCGATLSNWIIIIYWYSYSSAEGKTKIKKEGRRKTRMKDIHYRCKIQMRRKNSKRSWKQRSSRQAIFEYVQHKKG